MNYKIEYKSGWENKVADALSRRPHEKKLLQFQLTAHFSLNREELIKQMDRDVEIRTLVSALEKGENVEAKEAPFIPNILEQFHISSIGEHEGVIKTYKRLSRELC